MRFEHPEYLWFLLSIVVLAASYLFAIARRKKQLAAVGDERLVQQLIPERSKYRNGVRFLLICLALAFLIVGLANPQVGSKQETVKRKGVDIAIALDLSKSMLAEDIGSKTKSSGGKSKSKKPNRLDKSLRFIHKFVDKLQNDRVAFIVFAGSAHLQMPLTVDYSAFNLYLKNVNTDIMPTQGTAISESINLAEQAFEAGEKKHKVLVIISDGENHDKEAEEAAKVAHKEGTVIYTIGVGSTKGSPIPRYNKYNQFIDYKRDGDQVVISKLNENALRSIALNGGGKYFKMSSRNEEINSIMDDIKKMETKEIEEQVYTDYEDQFQFFLFISLVLILIEVFISTKKSNYKAVLKKWLG